MDSILPPSNSTQIAMNLNLDMQNMQNIAAQQAERVPIGVTVTGQVIGNDKNGNLIIRLSGSDLILSSPLALNKNAQVALKIENVSGSFTAQLLTVDGKTPATQPQSLSNQLQQNPQQQGQGQGQQGKSFQQNSEQSFATLKILSVLAQGTARPAAPVETQNASQQAAIKTDIVSLTSPQSTSLKGLVISATPEVIQSLRVGLSENTNNNNKSELADSLPEEITAGTQLDLKITSAQLPPAAQPKTQGQVDAGNIVLARQEFMENATQANQKSDIVKTFELEQLAQSQPQQQQTSAGRAEANNNLIQRQLESFIPAAKPLPNGNIELNAVVIDKKNNGEMLVETKLGKVIIDGGPQYSSITKGSSLTLELTKVTDAAQDILPLPDGDSTLQELGNDWPALKALTQHANDLGQNQLANKLAGVDNNFAARMAGFVNAVKTGNIRDWLGANNFDALDSDDAGSSILSKLTNDFSNLRDVLSQANSNWQTLLFPIYDGQQMHQAKLHVKYLPDQNNKPDKTAGTRFIVELDTSYFGEMQFDGLVHNTVPAKHFDLMIRSHTAMDSEIQKDIRQIFADAAEVTGFKGDIDFSTMKEFPVKVFDNLVENSINSKIDHSGIQA